MELNAWPKIMAWRIESQLHLDWNFGFVSWNLLFRPFVHLSQTFFAYSNCTPDHQPMTKTMLEEGAIQLCRGLCEKYVDVDCKMQFVRDYVSKIRYLRYFSTAAGRLLQNIEHVSRKFAGTAANEI